MICFGMIGDDNAIIIGRGSGLYDGKLCGFMCFTVIYLFDSINVHLMI